MASLGSEDDFERIFQIMNEIIDTEFPEMKEKRTSQKLNEFFKGVGGVPSLEASPDPLSPEAEERRERVRKNYEETERKPSPSTFKEGRVTTLQLPTLERRLFSGIQEKNSEDNTATSVSKKINERDFYAFCLGISKTLYNQSYKSGNQNENSGISRELSPKVKSILRQEKYRAEVVVSLSDLCRESYGVSTPDYRQKQALASLIKTLHNTPVEVQFGNGDKLESKLCVVTDEYTRAEDGAIFYNLILNPIFCEDVTNNFSELPQDITKRLYDSTDKLKAQHYKLLNILKVQDKRKPLVRNIETIVTDLGMEREYKKNKSRAEKSIVSFCETMVKIGMLKAYKVEKHTTGQKEQISKIIFYLNTDFCRTANPE